MGRGGEGDPRRARVVLFDLDGTLVDTMQLCAEAASELLASRGVASASEAREAYLRTAGMAFDDQLRAMGAPESLVRELHELFVERKREIVARASLAEPARALLRELREEGYVVALSTNNECELVAKVEGIEELHLVLCYDRAGHKKGGPHLATLKLLLGVSEEDVVFVGDSEHDLEVYESLGVEVVRTSGIFTEEEAKRVKEEVEKRFAKRA